ncbi:MAG: entericidin A/B family lipoprotein [Limisphaerales bacterium]
MKTFPSFLWLISISLIAALALLTASGCKNTAKGAGKDIENAGEKIQEKMD